METHSIAADFDLCYRAISSRDPRFDGRFYSAVTTTGVYCRPICPARTPHATHVRFYACAAAAEADGFRPCRRCRPETSPNSPDWNPRADLVARALRLIADGAVDTEGVTGLARRLAVSERHLNRILVAEVGAGPLALARTRRSHAARLLIDQTELSLTTIAFAAGFTSVRQFNHTMRAVFHCAPSAFRRRAPQGNTGGAELTLRLPYLPPFHAELLLAYLRRRALPGAEEVSERCYRRTVKLPRSRGIIELEPLLGEHAILLRTRLNSLRDMRLLVNRCRSLFDLDASPAAIADALRSDPLLEPLVAARPGLRVPGAVNGFELAVRAILGQQVSVAAARTLAGRLVAALGEPLEQPQGTLTHYFPTAEVIAQADLHGLGFTQGRITALHALAQAVAEGGVVLEHDADWQHTVTQLQRIRGIGPWTTSYIAMRALGDPDAFPAADLGLRQACQRQGMLIPGARHLARRAEAWRPWRAYAAHHLWASLPVGPERSSGDLGS